MERGLVSAAPVRCSAEHEYPIGELTCPVCAWEQAVVRSWPVRLGAATLTRAERILLGEPIFRAHRELEARVKHADTRIRTLRYLACVGPEIPPAPKPTHPIAVAWYVEDLGEQLARLKRMLARVGRRPVVPNPQKDPAVWAEILALTLELLVLGPGDRA
jgi:hypothetical protein